jgi:hypothetical protein
MSKPEIFERRFIDEELKVRKLKPKENARLKAENERLKQNWQELREFNLMHIDCCGLKISLNFLINKPTKRKSCGLCLRRWKNEKYICP